MTYFQVKPEHDGQQLYKKSGNRHNARIPNGYILIARELFTEGELKKFNVPKTCVASVKVEKSQICFRFGARFAR